MSVHTTDTNYFNSQMLFDIHCYLRFGKPRRLKHLTLNTQIRPLQRITTKGFEFQKRFVNQVFTVEFQIASSIDTTNLILF